jgi:1-acyl-sn-glycerol-3-phosphate acyltransferase
MIKAKHHIVIYPMFKLLTRFFMKRRFKSVQIYGDFLDNGNPVLVLSNHISWWDGFWMMHLNLSTIKRKFHFMMLEKQLRKNWYFRYSGGYSIKKQSRSVLESMHYTCDLLKQTGNMVFIFPQGQIHSMHQHNVHFEKGVSRIIEACPPETQILFSVNLLDFFSDPKPQLTMYIKTFRAKNFINHPVELAYNQFYGEVLENHKIQVS